MSSLWASMKKRRGSSNTNLATSGAVSSGRSSVSRDSREEDYRSDQSTFGSEEPPDDEDLAADEGCLRVSRFAGHVMSRSGFHAMRLPQSFAKGLRTGSLPRKFSHRSSDTPPTPAPTPEPKLLKPPLTEREKASSSRGFFKRASSASPSRASGPEVFRSFRGISSDRLPVPLRNFIRTRQTKELHHQEVMPPKPNRRPGPVGKTWVKVYDDITFMDDPCQEDLFPILGYKGYPTKIPEAEPLPVAPTPPPERVIQALDIESKSNVSVESEYDNVPKKRKIPNLEPSQRNEDKENISPNKLEEVLLNDMDRNSKPTTVTRPGRSREVSRYKAKRQKRTATPISRESALASEPNQPITPQKPEDDDEVMEDDYIIPQSIKPPKPPRGNKIYESITIASESKSLDGESNQKKLDESAEPEMVVNQVEESTQSPEEKLSEPSKPKRGIKIYESIVIKMKEDESGSKEKFQKPETNLKEIEGSKRDPEESAQTDDVSDKKELPPKPKRGIKIYETIQIGFRVDSNDNKNQETLVVAEGNKTVQEKEEKIETEVEADKDKKENEVGIQNSEVDIDKEVQIQNEKDGSRQEEPPTSIEDQTSPLKPARGNKIYANVEMINKANSETGAKEMKIEEDFTEKSEESRPPPLYARVKKSNTVKSLTDDSSKSTVPPAIPPKKRKANASRLSRESYSEHVYDILPPRPPRHLKPRPRSLESSPKHQKILQSIENDLLPTKPPRGSKLISENNIQSMLENNRATLSRPRSKRKHKSQNFDEKLKVPAKPMRHSQVRLLPAPPRRKKTEKTESEVTRTIDNEDTPPIPPPKRSKTFDRSNESKWESYPDSSTKENEATKTNFMNSVKENDVDSKALVDSKTYLSSNAAVTRVSGLVESESNLDDDIENNIKNIENTFETIDTVIKSIQEYASQGNLTDIKPVQSENNDESAKTDLIEKDLNKFRENISGLSVDSDISFNSDAETVISLGKEENKLSSESESERKLDRVCSQDDGQESKPIQVSLIIKSDEPVQLPKLEFENAKLSSEESKVTKIDRFDQNLTDGKTDIDLTSSSCETEVPIQLQTTQISEFKLEAEEQKPSEVTTEVPVKLSTTETSEFKLEAEEQKPSEVTTEVPVKLSTTETSEFKLEAEEQKPSDVTTEVPVKLSTTETSEFKLEQKPVPTELDIQLTSETTTNIPGSLSSSVEREFEEKEGIKGDKLSYQPLPQLPESTTSDNGSPSELTPRAFTPELENLTQSSPPNVPEVDITDPSGVSDLAFRLEGLRSQLDSIITNYPTSASSSLSSFHTALSESSNRSSVSLDFGGPPDSPISFASFYSPNANLSQSSLCSTQTFHTAASDSSFLSDSGTNTPSPSSQSSLKEDDDEDDEILIPEKEQQ